MTCEQQMDPAVPVSDYLMYCKRLMDPGGYDPVMNCKQLMDSAGYDSHL